MSHRLVFFLSISSALTCPSLMNASIVIGPQLTIWTSEPNSYDPENKNVQMNARFFGSLSNFASLNGYTHYQWFQLLTAAPPSTRIQTPYLDPALNGTINGFYSDNLVFYLNETTGSPSNGFYLYDPENSGGVGSQQYLNFVDVPRYPNFADGEFFAFETSLVGIYPDGQFDLLYTWTWKTNFRGDKGSGGIFPQQDDLPPEPWGIGGIFDIQLGVDPNTLSPEIRGALVSSGARNVKFDPQELAAIPEPNSLLLFVLVSLSVVMVRFARTEGHNRFARKQIRAPK